MIKKMPKGELNVTVANLKFVVNIRHARELKRANITGRDMLLDVVKYDNSQVLLQKEQEELKRHATMREVIENVGTKHSEDRVWQVEDPNIKEIRHTCRHPLLHDPELDDEP